MTQLYAQPTARNERINITTTSAKILDSTFLGQPRKQFILRNTSGNAADIITVSLGTNAALSQQGIVLEKGESYMESTVNNPTLDVWQGSIQAICETNNGYLSIIEV